MSSLSYNLNFEWLCKSLDLGELLSSPVALTGGLLHKMYAVETSKGKFAIKALNPQIMARSTALQNMIHSEQIANLAAKYVPALPAKIFNGSSLQQFDNQLYDWSAKSNRAAQQLSSNTVISHMDLDPKNVLWHENNPTLIDWEASGAINPLQNFCETAVYWSEEETGSISREKFSTFVLGYRKRAGNLQADWKLHWRAVFLACWAGLSTV